VKTHLLKNLLLPPLMIMKYTLMLLEVEIKKGNVYGLGALSKRFTFSKTVDSTTNQPFVVHQIEEMHKIVQKLNAELMTKHTKEQTLEEKGGVIDNKSWADENSSSNIFKWIIWCQVLQILLPMNIIEKTTLEMIVQMRINYMMNFIIHWTIFNLLTTLYITFHYVICLYYYFLCYVLKFIIQ